MKLDVRFQLKRDTAADWAARNPKLLDGEPGVETDTGRMKIGDGETLWNDLAYWGTITGSETLSTLGTLVNSAAAKTVPVDADNFPLTDSAAGHVTRKITGQYLKAWLKSHFDSIYQTLNANLTTWSAKVAPSSVVVGTTDTQTLANKTIDGSANTLQNVPVGAIDNAGLTEMVQDTIGSSVVAGANVTVSYNDATGQTTVSATGGTGGATTMDELSDVAVSSPADGHVLRHNGTNWVNTFATTADVADSTDKRYVTDAQRTVIQNTSGTNTGDEPTLNNTFGNSLSNMVTTIAGLGNPERTVWLDRAATVSADLTIPANIKLRYRDTGSISVNSGVTVTINHEPDVRGRQIFTGAGSVVFGSNKPVRDLDLSWWTGRDDSVDVTAKIDMALTSLANAGGGRLYAGPGTWLTVGGHIIPRYSEIVGAGQGITTFKQTSTATYGYLFRIAAASGQYYRFNKVKSLTLSGEGVTGETLLEFYGAAAADTPMFFIDVEQVQFWHGTIGCNYNSTSGDWQIESVRFKGCNWYNCTTGYKMNSINNSVFFSDGCFWDIPANGIALHLVSHGQVSIDDYNFIGPGTAGGTYSYTATGGVNNGATFILMENAHNGLRIANGQDEAAEYFLRTSTNSFLQSVITIDNCTIQSKIKPSAARTIKLVNCLTIGNVLQDNAGVAAAYIWEDSHCDTRDLDNSTNANAKPDYFTGSSYYAKKSDKTKNDLAIKGKIDAGCFRRSVMTTLSGSTVDGSLGDEFVAVITADTALNFTGGQVGREITLFLYLNDGTSRTISFGGNFRATGSLVTPAGKAGAFCVITFKTYNVFGTVYAIETYRQTAGA
ncbi:MAG: hypothetical protein ACK4S4_15860 [Pyrinomonadaceae bacterium]